MTQLGNSQTNNNDNTNRKDLANQLLENLKQGFKDAKALESLKQNKNKQKSIKKKNSTESDFSEEKETAEFIQELYPKNTSVERINKIVGHNKESSSNTSNKRVSKVLKLEPSQSEQEQIDELKRIWEKQNIRRNYTAEDVVRLRDPYQNPLMKEEQVATWFRERIGNMEANSSEHFKALGVYHPWQSLNMSKALKKMQIEAEKKGVAGPNGALYLSGWMVAALSNEFGMLSDQSMHPKTGLIQLVQRINQYLDQETRNAWQRGELEKGETYRMPMVVDIDAGFGGVTATFLLACELVKAGATAIHIEDQLSSEKKCGHMGGKVLASVDEHIAKVEAVRMAFDVMGVPNGMVISRTDSLAATMLNRDDLKSREYLAGDTKAGNEIKKGTSAIKVQDGQWFVPEKSIDNNFYRLKMDRKSCVSRVVKRHMEFLEYADLGWTETKTADLLEVTEINTRVQDIRQTIGKMTAGILKVLANKIPSVSEKDWSIHRNALQKVSDNILKDYQQSLLKDHTLFDKPTSSIEPVETRQAMLRLAGENVKSVLNSVDASKDVKNYLNEKAQQFANRQRQKFVYNNSPSFYWDLNYRTTVFDEWSKKLPEKVEGIKREALLELPDNHPLVQKAEAFKKAHYTKYLLNEDNITSDTVLEFRKQAAKESGLKLSKEELRNLSNKHKIAELADELIDKHIHNLIADEQKYLVRKKVLEEWKKDPSKDISAYDKLTHIKLINLKANDPLVLEADKRISQFQGEAAKQGVKFHFITLPTFHSIALHTQQFVTKYNGPDAMLAYTRDVQRAEKILKIHTFEHQRAVGTDFYDKVSSTAKGGVNTTGAMHGATADQFNLDAEKKNGVATKIQEIIVNKNESDINHISYAANQNDLNQINENLGIEAPKLLSKM